MENDWGDFFFGGGQQSVSECIQMATACCCRELKAFARPRPRERVWSQVTYSLRTALA